MPARLFVALLVLHAAQAVFADVTGAQVRRAIQAGVRALTRLQRPDGSWPERHVAGGETCLATLALLTAGEPVDSPAVAAALRQIQTLPDERTYVVALKLMVLSQADPQRFRREIAAAARWLADAQQAGGLWAYTQHKQPFDHSNSQFALLGLHAAATAGVTVPRTVWLEARTAVLGSQLRDGGWSYRSGGESYGSMTAANVCNLLILGEQIAGTRERGFVNGRAPDCGRYQGLRPLVNGLNWLGRHFTAEQNPQRGRNWVYYWLYAAERAGMLSGQRFFGPHDWYREGAEFLVSQQGATGLWADSIVETSLAILFLAKGHKALLVQKLQWSEDERWNPDRHDLENLIAYIGERLGEPVTWQSISFDAPLEEWLAAPLLYFQGHDFPTWSEPQRRKLRAFVEQGGTLLAEACCSGARFRAGFEAFVESTFPEQPLVELDAAHPVYAAHFESPPYGLMGVDFGCRTSVLFSPKDLSCLWEQATLPELSERAFQLGTNIAALAIGHRPLRDRLDVITLPAAESEPSRLPPGDALRLAQLVHEGDWRPDAHALEKLAELLGERAGVSVVTRYRSVRATPEELSGSPILFVTGHHRFELSEQEVAALRDYLRRGGFILAEACCGSAAFDAGWREQLARIVPGQSLKRLPADHAIFRGQPGERLERVAYKPAAAAGGEAPPSGELWGLELSGRLAVVYSPYALGCGLEGHVCHNCRGLVDEDARKLAINIVLYALTR